MQMLMLAASLFLSLLVMETEGASSHAASSSSAPRTPEGRSTRSRLPYLMKTPNKPSLIFSDEHDIIQSLVAIFKDKKNAQIYVNSFFFTDYALAQALAQLCKDHTKKVSVFSLVNSTSTGHGKIALRILADAGAQVRVYRGTEQNHHKYVIWSYLDSAGKEHYGLYAGSGNLTYMARQNIEHGVITRIDKTLFDEYRRNFSCLYRHAEKFISPVQPTFEPLEDDEVPSTPTSHNHSTTPRSPFKTPSTKSSTTLFAPSDTQIPTSIINRIEKTEAGGEIYISAYSYDWPKLTQVLCHARNRGISVSLIVDQTALKKNNRFKPQPLVSRVKEQLDLLAAMGVKIMVYAGRGIQSHHQKIIALKDQNRTIVGESSLNFTQSSHQDQNRWTWYAHYKDMFDKIRKQHKTASKSRTYIPYARFCAEHEEKYHAAAPQLPSRSIPSKRATGSSRRMIRPTQSSSFYEDHPLADDSFYPY